MTSKSTRCFHCLSPIEPHVNIKSIVRGETAHFCCTGCLGVTEWIYDSGLSNYYKVRTGAPKVNQELSQQYAQYDLPEIYQKYTTTVDAITAENSDALNRQIDLHVGDTHCGACMWLIEKSLQQLPGVTYASGNATTHALRIQWQDNDVSLSTLLQTIAQLGYRPLLGQASDAQTYYLHQRKTNLKRLSLAGIGMMQVMMYSVALYAGAFSDMSTPIKQFLQWVSFFITTPVYFYSGYPFLQSLFRAITALYKPLPLDSKRLPYFYRQLNMNVPVGLAITLAYGFSVYHLLIGEGEVYFDSVVMFIFFLSASRYLEIMGKNKAQRDSALNEKRLPEVIQRLENDRPIPAPLDSLAVGEKILVQAGEIIAADGIVSAGQSSVDESLLTGEARPITKTIGDSVFAGTINQEQRLTIEVEAIGNETALAKTQSLINSAQTRKPQLQEITDRLAGYVVAFILLSTSITYVVWTLFIDSERAFEVMLAVLVATCPCALSLSVPTAYATASNVLTQCKVFMRNNMALDMLPKINEIFFDKTGTLTTDDMRIVQFDNRSEWPDATVLAIVAALEKGIYHPIAKAFRPYFNPQIQCHDAQIHTAKGISGTIDGERYFIGNHHAIANNVPQPQALSQGMLYLTQNEKIIAEFQLSDDINPTAYQAIKALSPKKLRIISGDSAMRVSEIANKLGITTYTSEQRPEEKLATVDAQQKNQQHVMMIGDGINDAPVLAQADVSVAVGNASALSRAQADIVLPQADLDKIPFLFRLAKATRRIITQNLVLSIGYNVSAIPLAIMGFLPPWAAALGMSLSSLVVLANALRINWIKP